MNLLGVIILLSTAVLVQNASIGRCPKVEVMQNFEASKYAGTWYEFQKYFYLLEVGAKCITNNITVNSDGSLKVISNQKGVLTGRPSSIEGIATFSGNITEGKLKLRFPKTLIPPKPYWILGTDYDNYAVVYSCKNFLLSHSNVVWILTRSREPSSTVLSQALEILKNNKLSTSKLKKTNQKNCS